MSARKRFVRARDFAFYHDVTTENFKGWTITFALHYTANRGNVPHVWATSPTGRTNRDLKFVATLLPVEDWPEFARKAFTKAVEAENQGRLF